MLWLHTARPKDASCLCDETVAFDDDKADTWDKKICDAKKKMPIEVRYASSYRTLAVNVPVKTDKHAARKSFLSS